MYTEWLIWRVEKIGSQPQHLVASKCRRRAFTLVELLVVISVISLLMAILGPALSKAKRRARIVLGMNNQKQVAAALNLFAMDNDDCYPESVATVGPAAGWNWSEPTRLAGRIELTGGPHRSVAEYLRSYIPDADVIHCPSAPKKYKYLQEAWDAGDDWDNPDTAFFPDPLVGTYCLLWNYSGYLTQSDAVISGPSGPAVGPRRSKLLIADYFGYGRDGSPTAYGSCQRFKGVGITPETLFHSAYWSRVTDPNAPMPDVKLHAAYIDGHVEDYRTSEAVLMEVFKNVEKMIPYDIPGPGIYYLPPAALW